MKSRDVSWLPSATQWLVSSVLTRPRVSQLQALYLSRGNEGTFHSSTGPDTLLLYRFLGLALGPWSMNFQQTPGDSYAIIPQSTLVLYALVKKGKCHWRHEEGSNSVKIIYSRTSCPGLSP